ncbi:SDR family oxidoreductase [Streptomyces sp. JNUCC 63]
MRIAVAGATGNIGSLTVAALERAGHDVVRISRSLGVDLRTGDGLDAALTGVEAVIDATSHEAADRDETVAFFGTTTRNLLAAEERAGVRHHVLLSIVGVDRATTLSRTGDGPRRSTTQDHPVAGLCRIYLSPYDQLPVQGRRIGELLSAGAQLGEEGFEIGALAGAQYQAVSIPRQKYPPAVDLDFVGPRRACRQLRATPPHQPAPSAHRPPAGVLPRCQQAARAAWLLRYSRAAARREFTGGWRTARRAVCAASRGQPA